MSHVRYCDGAASTTPCPHPDNCTVDCQFNNGVVKRTIKPYPAVPDDVVEEAAEQWLSISEMLVGAVWAAVLVIVTLLVFSCLFMWGKLV